MTLALPVHAVAARLNEGVPDAVLGEGDGWLLIAPETVLDTCRFLKETAGLDFDFPESISAVDYIDHFQVVYHLLSLRKNQSIVLKVDLYEREEPALPSVTSVWPGADLQEREIYDLMGIHFDGHPNMKRILLWDGFPGHPLRKDYRQEF